MILGATCTRACAFCNVATGKPDNLDPHEPLRVAIAIGKLGLEHVVVTSVDRDDLDDGGAQHFVETIQQIRRRSPKTTIEILTPDFKNKPGAAELIAATPPDVFNHNLETVPRLYPSIRPGARYFGSLQLLARIKEIDPSIFTKSGIMVGLGETREEVGQVMDDLRRGRRRFPDHRPISRADAETCAGRPLRHARGIQQYEAMARAKGFLMVSASPLTRSSYHAGDDFRRLREARAAKLAAAE